MFHDRRGDLLQGAVGELFLMSGDLPQKIGPRQAIVHVRLMLQHEQRHDIAVLG
jgi:hypothetical protein